MSAEEFNYFLIRASAPGSGPHADTDYIEPFRLQSYADEFTEIEELESRLGWAGAVEAGKFNSHEKYS
ncbi:hypothetical protein BBP40_004988 [Aspergillus hancockii]|nr:hypothetical protein BBP40_004988 [Aspergillus hancockii]